MQELTNKDKKIIEAVGDFVSRRLKILDKEQLHLLNALIKNLYHGALLKGVLLGASRPELELKDVHNNICKHKVICCFCEEEVRAYGETYNKRMLWWCENCGKILVTKETLVKEERTND